MEQWKNAKELVTKYIEVAEFPIENVSHFTKLNIGCRTFQMETVLDISELFCTGPLDDKNSFSINLTGGSPNRKELTATLSPLTDEVDHWYYRAAINSEKLLFIGLGARWLRFS